jgi:hypothetical protein
VQEASLIIDDKKKIGKQEAFVYNGLDKRALTNYTKWQNGAAVNYTDWPAGEPATFATEHCALYL